MSHARIPMPKPLSDAFDTYFQTSKFAQKNFLKFNKEIVLAAIERAAARYGYTVDRSAYEPGFKGVFKLNRKTRSLRVSAATLPLAEDWT